MKLAAASLVRNWLAAPNATPTVPRNEEGFDQFNFRSNMPMVPPSASLPYCADAGPRTISMWPISAAGSQAMYWLGPSRHAAVL